MTKNATRNGTSRAHAQSLRNAIHDHLIAVGYTANGEGYRIAGDISKQRIRDLHALHRRDVLHEQRAFVDDYGHDLAKFIATGRDIDPRAIDPELIEVESNTNESRLFRFATLMWSVPVSQGFGRRLRFLVRDRQNGCLIGLFAMGDPVFNLSARDNWIGWDHQDRIERLVHVMDAYVVGALPPYSYLIGGKLVAALMTSQEVKRVYERKYLGHEAVISQMENRARLVLLTTTSALGRSSLYNRLKIPGGTGFQRIGSTKGFGHFHLSGKIFEDLRSYLAAIDHPYAEGHRFGMGPNWKMRVVRAALDKLGINANEILQHRVEREVYAAPLAKNYQEILQGTQSRVQSLTLPAEEIGAYCVERWLIPRSLRDKTYKRFARARVMEALLNGGPGPEW